MNQENKAQAIAADLNAQMASAPPIEHTTFEEKRRQGEQKAAQAQEDNDFPLGKACDLSGEGTCDSCQ